MQTAFFQNLKKKVLGMAKAIWILLLVSVSVFFFVSCSSEEGKKNLSDLSLSNTDKNFLVRFSTSVDNVGESKETASKILKSAANERNAFELFKIDAVYLDIQSIEAHSEENGWIVLDNTAKKLNLLNLQNGISSILFEKTLPQGHYSQIRLMLGDKNEVFVDNGPYYLKIPSADQTGVKLVSDFVVEEGNMVEVKMDVDLSQSLKYQSGKGFSLKPTIKITGIHEAAGAGKVDPEGGTVTTTDDAVNLSLPQNSLSEEVVISVEKQETPSIVSMDSENNNSHILQA